MVGYIKKYINIFFLFLSANGDVIVTLLPANTKYPWVTPAIFRPELVPEELMAQGLTVSLKADLTQNITSAKSKFLPPP